MDCVPRFIYSGCPDEDKSKYKLFYIIILIMYIGFLFSYIIIELISKKGWRMDRFLRLSVILFLILGILTHISLINDNPYFGWIATSILYNWYCLIMYGTTMIVVRKWVQISLTIMNIKSTSYKAYKVFSWFIVINWMFVAVGIIITDIISAIVKEWFEYLFIAQCQFWAISCISLSLFFIISGRKIDHDVKQSIKINSQTSNKMRVLLLKFRIIYFTFVILGFPYAILHELNAFTKGIVMWFICHSLFHGAGIIIAILLLLLIGIKRNNNDSKPSSNISNSSSKVKFTDSLELPSTPKNSGEITAVTSNSAENSV